MTNTQKEREDLVNDLKDHQPEKDIDESLAREPTNVLEEVETLRFANISLQQQLVEARIAEMRAEHQRLHDSMGVYVQEVRDRLGIPVEVSLQFDPDFKTVTEMPDTEG
jgi:hypothetical protein